MVSTTGCGIPVENYYTERLIDQAAALDAADEPRRIDRVHETTRQTPARHIWLIGRPVRRIADKGLSFCD